MGFRHLTFRAETAGESVGDERKGRFACKLGDELQPKEW